MCQILILLSESTVGNRVKSSSSCQRVPWATVSNPHPLGREYSGEEIEQTQARKRGAVIILVEIYISLSGLLLRETIDGCLMCLSHIFLPETIGGNCTLFGYVSKPVLLA